MRLAADPALRARLGNAARAHVSSLASPDRSVVQLERALSLAVADSDNPHAASDASTAASVSDYVDAHGNGFDLEEKIRLRLDGLTSKLRASIRHARARLRPAEGGKAEARGK